jgi:hypothetical protein
MNWGYNLNADTCGYIALGAMSVFCFGLLLLKIFVRLPKGLIAASFISYVLILIFILLFIFRLPVSKNFIVAINPLFWIVMGPSYCIAACIEALSESRRAYFLKEGWFGATIMRLLESEPYVYMYIGLLAFCLNTLLIFVIIRLFLKHKVVDQKPVLYENSSEPNKIMPDKK